MKNLTLFLGITIFTLSILLSKNIKNSEKIAFLTDKDKSSYGFVEGPPLCNWEVKEPERIMAENKTQAIIIDTSNPNDIGCETVLFLRAPSFDISPFKEDQTIKLEASSSGSISWIISPRKVGSYEIALTDNLNTKVFGINVKNMLGLSAIQAKLASALGTIFSPMLTIPWWWDKLRKKQVNP